MNIWSAGGRGMKDKDTNRGKGATRGQRGPMRGPLTGHTEATEEGALLGVSGEQKPTRKKTCV